MTTNEAPAPPPPSAGPRDDYGVACRLDILRQVVSDINANITGLKGNTRETMLNVVRRVALKAGVQPDTVGLR